MSSTVRSFLRVCWVVCAALAFTGVCASAQSKKPAAAPKAPAKAPSVGGAKPGGAAAGVHPGGAAGGVHPGGAAGGVHPGGAAGGVHPGGAVAGNRGGGAAGGRGGSFGGRPSPAGSHEVRGANGSVMRTRADGSRSDFHDDRRGMDVHHNLDGNRRVMVERGDHSRVFAERGGRGYVQHPYMYHGREFGHRTYYDHGRYYDRYYNRYGYRGAYLDVYAPVRYYGVGFYGWAYNPWAVPIAYGWGWGAAPWYGYYGGYFAPYAVYPSASYWLTDYLIAQSLQAAYEAQAAAVAAADAPPAGAPVLTPEIKAMIAAEVQQEIALENAEAAQNAGQRDIDPAGSSIARMLSDNRAHVFVVGSDLDLVAQDGTECPVSQGDVLQVAGAPAADATAANAVVLSSKGWRRECRASLGVSVAFTDLQDMQNHMRETIDAGMTDLQSKQGQGGLPAAPPSAQAAATPASFTAGAPPPDQTAAADINQQAQAADQAEREASGGGPSAGVGSAPMAPVAPPPAPAGPPPTISVGQTVDQVVTGFGQPKRVIDLGAKKIYIYNDMKVTFKEGKVSDVQ